MKVKVNQDTCIGCGACQAICPNIFEIGDDGHAVAKVDTVPESDVANAQDAKESCPVGAITEE